MIKDWNDSTLNTFFIENVPVLLEAHSVAGVWKYRYDLHDNLQALRNSAKKRSLLK